MPASFYRQLDAFSEFGDFTVKERYLPLPNDWVVVVADIVNSTKAIQDGLYKEVNLIGAACITQTMKSLETLEIPFVFGGDGASLCLPSSRVNAVARQLGKLQNLAGENYDLTLRVAVIPVVDIRSHGADVLVAKLEITRHNYIALFRGGGLAVADSLSKESDGRYAINMEEQVLDSLEGLSCRWSPVPSRQGKVISLLVMARHTDAMDVYSDLLANFRRIMGREITEANPVEDNLNTYRGFFQAVREESRYHRKIWSFSFLARLMDICLAVLIFRYGLNPIPILFEARTYKDAIGSHSDYRKFDDTLRLITDCSPEELDALYTLLDEGYQKGVLYYGAHTSDQALMTCFVETTGQGKHLHFIDGGDGGLAIAAQQLKKQLSRE